MARPRQPSARAGDPRGVSAGRATIADVAVRAGVATSTVSRVLNDGQVSAPARRRVTDAIAALGYRPHAGARALAAGPKGAFGMIVPFATSPSAAQRLRGVLAPLQSIDRELVLCNVSTPRQREEYLGLRAPIDRVDGLLIISLTPRDSEAAMLIGTGVPTVLIDADHPALPRLVTDDVAGGTLAARHLIELGHERIAFLGDRRDPDLGFVSSARRAEGYRSAMRAAGLMPNETIAAHGHDAAVRAARELFGSEARPTAIFASSDLQALGVLEAARLSGLSVPRDLSVVGYDDLDVSAYVGLSTVDQGLEASGRRGVERLLELVAGRDDGPLAHTLPLTLRARQTSAPPRR